MPSEHTFTGQRSFVDAVGLMDYGARFYDPALGRFVSADSLVPEPGNPQSVHAPFGANLSAGREIPPLCHVHPEIGTFKSAKRSG
jgi:RHS repeat-associated protein